MDVESRSASRDDRFVISTDPARLDVDVIHSYLTRSYWAADIPIHVVMQALANSINFGLYEGTTQIGFARVVSDRATFAWVCDVFVLEGWRGRGLSKWLIECVRSAPQLQGLRRWILATRDAHGLYAQFGFKPLAAPDRWLEITDPDLYRRSTSVVS